MDHNGFVSSPPLYHQHMLNDCHDGRRRGAQTLRGPTGHLELSHLVCLARLQERTVAHSAYCCHEIFTELYYLWVWWLAMHKPPSRAGSHLCNYLLLNKCVRSCVYYVSISLMELHSVFTGIAKSSIFETSTPKTILP